MTLTRDAARKTIIIASEVVGKGRSSSHSGDE
jgi:hypothetical protein